MNLPTQIIATVIVSTLAAAGTALLSHSSGINFKKGLIIVAFIFVLGLIVGTASQLYLFGA